MQSLLSPQNEPHRKKLWEGYEICLNVEEFARLRPEGKRGEKRKNVETLLHTTTI
jgi:hypothetical protein